jgi:hypothetical protein
MELVCWGFVLSIRVKMKVLIISGDDDDHHMALQPNSGPGLLTITFLRGWIVSPAPNPQPGGPGLRIHDPRRQGVPAIPPGTWYPF